METQPSRHGVGRLIDLIKDQHDPFHISHHKLSYETDIRILVVRTLLTYLELAGLPESNITAVRHLQNQTAGLITCHSGSLPR